MGGKAVKKRAPGADRTRLVGRRVALRLPRIADRAEFAELRESSREFLAPWESDHPRGLDPFGREASVSYIARPRTTRRLRLLVCRGSDGRIAGAVTLFAIAGAPLASATLGYWIGAAYARLGYMHEALELLLAFAFERMKLRRIEALVLPENAPSRALLERLGFEFEGIARRYAKTGGVRRDHERWALTRD